LKDLFSLFITSHYKNSPNDLQLLSDNPSHDLFVLLGEIKKEDGEEGTKKLSIPTILCAIQIAHEGSLGESEVFLE
jgi:N-acetyltransferase 10